MSSAGPDAAVVFPERIDAGIVRLEVHGPDHAAAVADAINESLEHLAPWMAWAQRATTAQEQAMRLALAVEQARAGGDAVYSIVDATGVGAIAGGCGLHRRRQDTSLDIGYWLHPGHTRRGFATAAAAALTRVAMEVGGADVVRITCDAANTASAAVPARLGFVHVATLDDRGAEQAPNGSDLTLVWEMTADAWPMSHGASVPVSYG